MEWLLREEVALLLAILSAGGLLVLGTLELLWPTRRRPAGLGAAALTPALSPDPSPADPAPPAAAPRGRAEPEERAAVALRVGRALLARALEEPNPLAEVRARLLCRAIACFERGLEAAPEDARLQHALADAHEALAMADPQAAFRWLVAATPWRPRAADPATATPVVP